MSQTKDISKFGDLRGCACFNVRAAARALTRDFDEALRPVGLKTTQFTVLAAISLLNEAVPIGTLAKTLSMDRTTLTRNLRPLEKRELVEVSPEGYRRARGMALTAKGRQVLERAVPLWRRAQETAVGRIGADRWTALRGELADLSNTS